MSGELEHRVPVDTDWRERIETKLDALVVALLGSLEKPGGALKRLDTLESKVAAIESAKTAETTQALTWKNALGLTVAGGLISKALDWAQHHIK